MRAATALLALLMSAMPAAGTASTGGSTAGAASTTAAPGAAARQEAQVLGEVLGWLRSLEGETARLKEAQHAAEARHRCCCCCLRATEHSYLTSLSYAKARKSIAVCDTLP
jgi:hypothetical protein